MSRIVIPNQSSIWKTKTLHTHPFPSLVPQKGRHLLSYKHQANATGSKAGPRFAKSNRSFLPKAFQITKHTALLTVNTAINTPHWRKPVVSPKEHSPLRRIEWTSQGQNHTEQQSCSPWWYTTDGQFVAIVRSLEWILNHQNMHGHQENTSSFSHPQKNDSIAKIAKENQQ